MPESKKRVIVDGVDFASLFYFPRIISAVTASLQPARLVIGLLMLVVLITFGRAWDAMTPASVKPHGLTAGRWSADSPEARDHQRILRSAMSRFPVLNEMPSDTASAMEPKAGHVLQVIARSYHLRRDAASTAEERERLNQEYTVTVDEINKSRPRTTFEATVSHVTGCIGLIVRGALALNAQGVIDGASALFIDTPRMLWQDHHWFAMAFGVFFIVVYSIGGGALSRMAACQMATHERLPIREAVDFAISDFVRLVSAMVLPMLIAGAICLVLVVMGVLMGAPMLDVVGGLLYGLALMLGFLVAFLLLGYLVGFPMLVPAVACENCDGADAMQRAYAYVVTRPLHVLAYWAVALIGLALGFALVSVVATLTLNATAALYDALTANPAMTAAGGYELFELSQRPIDTIPGSWHSQWAGTIIQFWQGLLVTIVGAYVVAYHFGASTIVYLLMRRVCDGQEIDEIWRPGLAPGAMTPGTSPSTPAPAIVQASPPDAAG